MKKTGIINRDIATILAHMGHTDRIVIADCGLPIPDQVPCIDLSLKLGEPSFTNVLEIVLEDMVVEKMTLAQEIKINNSALHDNLINNYSAINIDYITHEELKQQLSHVKAIIRTGEATPYANVILQSGVLF
ncbi:D-ribose pyranase [Ornithinibacillus bavariensis]|uniref:D-ribose pyranase n=1 Tax=Ornithinibacillus bavariensis TaxID=545502 RepID=A0A919X4X5_9BACI|nr:D-ribose pyranase [Ornithinibacillus bavariensis]GIO25591.1 D-ribose pyranase [Ornithinibacillus bavariensis]